MRIDEAAMAARRIAKKHPSICSVEAVEFIVAQHSEAQSARKAQRSAAGASLAAAALLVAATKLLASLYRDVQDKQRLKRELEEQLPRPSDLDNKKRSTVIDKAILDHVSK